ncbi:MAG TPA: hypothetical protein VGB26_01480 [Nitrospiria bacterium]|jgi:sulfur transfer complex TusBCD TusB component (DsrH family)
MKTLHVVRTLKERIPFDLAIQFKEYHRNAILLIQEGVYYKGPFPQDCFISATDLTARGIASSLPTLTDDEICKMIVEYDRTIIW